MVDEHAVHRLRPLVALPGAAPGVDGIAVRIECEHRRRTLAAGGGRRIEFGALLIVVQGRAAAMDDPEVVLRIDRGPDGHAQKTLAGDRLGPQRIDLEHRDFHHCLLRRCHGLQQGHPAAKGNRAGSQKCREQDSPPVHSLEHAVLPLSFLNVCEAYWLRPPIVEYAAAGMKEIACPS